MPDLPPLAGRSGADRLALARWLVRSEIASHGAGGREPALAAALFGEGLVETADDFGTRTGTASASRAARLAGRGQVPDARDDALADAFVRRLERPQENIRIRDREVRVRGLRIGASARDRAGGQRVLVLEREPHGAGLVVRGPRLEREPLEEVRIARLVQDRVRGPQRASGDHRELRRRRVERADGAVPEPHEVGVGSWKASRPLRRSRSCPRSGSG